MLKLISRVVSTALIIALVFHETDDGRLMMLRALSGMFAGVLIWFPEFIDDVTFGTWRVGYQIDSHSPRFLIAAVGWVLLATQVASAFRPGWLGQMFGM